MMLSWCLYLSFCSIGRLRAKLNRSNMTEVSFMIVNEKEALSRAMYWELKRRAPPDVPVYQQTPFQDDVWEALDGDKDDFLVYDRSGKPPYSDMSIKFRFFIFHVKAQLSATKNAQKFLTNLSILSLPEFTVPRHHFDFLCVYTYF